ncbi:lysophospholipid acyltransferase family protein [Sulfuricystis multivorans]|uniref:lysophospholipid acyltransferase family protein n=1 Tax=Sulfuricystis multivorans TaxID=2211108 RepID=UPI000F8227F7|nr:lysophospholipid acyltransferase family protein [Sulfuricystis multivorans]
MIRLLAFLMWLVTLLPFPLLAGAGRGLGLLLYLFGRERRQVTLINLGLCFPTLSEQEKSALARRHFMLFGRSFLERGMLWWSSPERIRRRVKLTGREHLDALKGRPVILLVPHFLGLDAAWTRLSMEYDLSGIYANQKDPVFNALLYAGRARFGRSLMLSRQDGTLRGVRAIRSGYPFFYLPDLDYGPRDAIFVPFFGVPAATITGLSRLTRLTGATVLPVIARMTDDGYRVSIGEPWRDFPGASVEMDTRRMNAFIEAEVMKMPEQYYWLHKRFKTRPPGEKRPY